MGIAGVRFSVGDMGLGGFRVVDLWCRVQRVQALGLGFKGLGTTGFRIGALSALRLRFGWGFWFHCHRD